MGFKQWEQLNKNENVKSSKNNKHDQILANIAERQVKKIDNIGLPIVTFKKN
jgi:hypothetical protein